MQFHIEVRHYCAEVRLDSTVGYKILNESCEVSFESNPFQPINPRHVYLLYRRNHAYDIGIGGTKIFRMKIDIGVINVWQTAHADITTEESAVIFTCCKQQIFAMKVTNGSFHVPLHF